jgi:hypothetical protein
VDEVIGQAQATAAALVSQRGIFANVATNLGNIGGAVQVDPAVDPWLERTRFQPFEPIK